MIISRPTLLIDEKKCKDNIRRMAEKAAKSKLIFRPHFKTHQSKEIGKWFKDIGVNKITVSSVSMAEYFSNHGWNDILIAFPVNILEIKETIILARKVNLHLLVDSLEVIQFITENLTSKVGIYLKIDTGYHRTGILPSRIEKIHEILSFIKKSDNIEFTGFLTHAGNTYDAKSENEILNIHSDSISQLNVLKDEFSMICPDLIISTGDTPACSLATDFSGVDEIRPGNFVYYDLMQLFLNSCTIDNIAVAVACPVVAKYPDRKEIVFYGGAVHLSKEFVKKDKGKEIFGLVVKIDGRKWSQPLPDTYVSGLSQEHGILKTNSKVLESIKIGDIIGILPIHSCLTANLMKYNLQII